MDTIDLAKKGDKQAFNILIEENKMKMYKTAKAILKDEDDVCDAIQEALIRAYQNINKLYYYDDLPVRDISKALNIPEGTVKSRLSRARERIYEMLKQEEGECCGGV